jgi:peptide/nickel transport system permease protein
LPTGTRRTVIFRDALQNALLPVVTSIAMGMAGLVSGGVLTETVFSWPGMGAYLVSRTLSYDYPAVQGAFYMLAIITIIANWVADILYAYLDPRIRL